MDVAISTMSSKGQVVIPAHMRQGMREGDKLLLLRTKDQIIMKQATSLDKALEEDLAFAKKTDEAWNRVKTKGVRKDFDAFIDEMKQW